MLATSLWQPVHRICLIIFEVKNNKNMKYGFFLSLETKRDGLIWILVYLDTVKHEGPIYLHELKAHYKTHYLNLNGYQGHFELERSLRLNILSSR